MIYCLQRLCFEGSVSTDKKGIHVKSDCGCNLARPEKEIQDKNSVKEIQDKNLGANNESIIEAMKFEDDTDSVQCDVQKDIAVPRHSLQNIQVHDQQSKTTLDRFQETRERFVYWQTLCRFDFVDLTDVMFVLNTRSFHCREEQFLMQRLRPLWNNFDDLSPVMLLERGNLYFHLNCVKKEKIRAETIITESILQAAADETSTGGKCALKSFQKIVCVILKRMSRTNGAVRSDDLRQISGGYCCSLFPGNRWRFSPTHQFEGAAPS